MASEQDFAYEAICLTNLISSTVQTIIREYAAAGKQLPSLNSVIPGPFDRPETASDGLLKAVQIIEAACAQLTSLVASPGHTVINVRTNPPIFCDYQLKFNIIESFWGQRCSVSSISNLNVNPQHLEPACFRVVINAKIADILVDHPTGLHIRELAATSGLELGKLRRILKFLATKHCFREGKIVTL